MSICYPTYTKGLVDVERQGKMVISEGITKFHSGFVRLQLLEKYHEGTIENVRILSRKNKSR